MLHGNGGPLRLATRLAALVLLACVVIPPATAGAAVQSFSLSPGSGPPGSTVHVSGGGCAPGLLPNPLLDFVQVVAATLPPQTLHLGVTTNGSWSGSFVVPANALPLPVAVTATCSSDGLGSLLTIYTPQVFTVTAPAAPTSAPPTTPPAEPPSGDTPGAPGSTDPGTTPAPGTSPVTIEPGPGRGSTPGPSAAPGVGGAPGGPGTANGAAGPGNAGSGTSSGAGDEPGRVRALGRAGADPFDATGADLPAPVLADAHRSNSSGAWTWFARIAVALSCGAAIAFGIWLRRRRHQDLHA